ncbi:MULTISPECIES: hypothetical protein [Burkholderia]|jgi:hypothetical protein|nr:hypothetical protein [Burkholderia ambifaria]AJY26646.1 hypothetical protein CH72_5778 [Burkholderia ambifaria AMMD]
MWLDKTIDRLAASVKAVFVVYGAALVWPAPYETRPARHRR